MTTTSFRRTQAAIIIGLLLMAGPANAAMVGTPFSGPTAADPAALFWNPAAMTLMGGTQGMLHGAVVPVRVHYQRDVPDSSGRPYPRADMMGPLPDFFAGAVTDVGGRLGPLRVGLGASLPLVDGADWNPTTAGGQPSPARYYSLRTFLAWLTISPALAYRINRYISVGAGLDVTAAMISSEVIIDMGARANQLACKALGPSAPCPTDAPLPREDPRFDASMTLDGVGWDVGAFAGVLLTPAPWLKIGAVFHSGTGGVDVPVEINVAIPAAARQLMDQSFPSIDLPPIQASATLEVHSPMMVAASVWLNPFEPLELTADFQWIDKSKMSTFNAIIGASGSELITDQVVINPFSDFWAFGLRGVYRLLPALTVGLGVAYEPNTRPDALASPLTVDMHKIIARLGVSWRPIRRVSVVLDYAHIFAVPRRVGATLYGPNAAPSTPQEEALDRPVSSGRYTAEADRAGLAVLLHFD